MNSIFVLMGDQPCKEEDEVLSPSKDLNDRIHCLLLRSTVWFRAKAIFETVIIKVEDLKLMVNGWNTTWTEAVILRWFMKCI